MNGILETTEAIVARSTNDEDRVSRVKACVTLVLANLRETYSLDELNGLIVSVEDREGLLMVKLSMESPHIEWEFATTWETDFFEPDCEFTLSETTENRAEAVQIVSAFDIPSGYRQAFFTDYLNLCSRYASALKVLNLVDPEKLGGSWRGSMRLSRGQTLEAAGRKADALKSYRDVVTDGSASESHRRAAGEAAAALESGN